MKPAGGQGGHANGSLGLTQDYPRGGHVVGLGNWGP